MLHRRTTMRRAVLVTALCAVTGSLTAQPATAGLVPGSVLRTKVVFPPTMAPAPGAVVGLTAQPEPIWSTARDAQVQYLPEMEVATVQADASGAVAIDVPETPALVELANRQGGTVKAVLSYTAQQGTSDLPVYYRGVTPLVLTLDASSGAFSGSVPSLSVLHTLPEYDATVVQALGEKTLADVGTLLSKADPEVAAATAALEAEMARRGYLFQNEAVAYNVHTLDGTMMYVTLAPENLLVRESPDDDVYDIVGVTSGGFPAVDTTDEGDAVDDASGSLLTSKAERGKWRPHHGDCYSITGPTNQAAKRYKRTVCYRVDHQEMDTVKGTSFWQFEEDAFGTGLVDNKMFRIWVHGQKYGHGTAVPHTDRIPEPHETTYGNQSCSTQTSEISAESGAPIKVGVKTSWQSTKCKQEKNQPVMEDDGEHAAEWRADDPIDPGDVRATSLVLPVRANTADGCPLWNILSGQWVTAD